MLLLMCPTFSKKTSLHPEVFNTAHPVLFKAGSMPSIVMCLSFFISKKAKYTYFNILMFYFCIFVFLTLNISRIIHKPTPIQTQLSAILKAGQCLSKI